MYLNKKRRKVNKDKLWSSCKKCYKTNGNNNIIRCNCYSRNWELLIIE